MFTVIWDDPAFDQMNALIQWYPELRSEFRAALRILNEYWTDHGDTWGESRDDNSRLGFQGPLSVLIRVDEESEAIVIEEVQLNRNAPRG